MYRLLKLVSIRSCYSLVYMALAVGVGTHANAEDTRQRGEVAQIIAENHLAQPTGNGILSVPESDSMLFTFQNLDTACVWQIRAADLNGDRKTDLIWTTFAFEPGIQHGLFVAYGTGGTNFSSPILVQALNLTELGNLELAYVNGDTHLDILLVWQIASSGQPGEVMVLLNNGNNSYTLSSAHALPLESDVAAVAVGYFNDDAHLDMVANGLGFLGDGNGDFTQVDMNIPGFRAAEVSDFNNDGIDDLILSVGSNMEIHLNNGLASFSLASSQFVSSYHTYSIVTGNTFADFDRDGNSDFALVSPHVDPWTISRLTVIFGDGAGGMDSVYQTLIPFGASYNLVLTDVNRDHELDIVTTCFSDSWGLFVYYGDGARNFSEPDFVSWEDSTVAPVAVATGDIDRDGNPDFVSGHLQGDGPIRLAISALPGAPVLADEMHTTGFKHVGIKVINPSGFSIAKRFRTVAGSDYLRYDTDLDGEIDERAIDYNLQYGEYRIIITPQPDAPVDAPISMAVGIGDSQQLTMFADYTIPVEKRTGSVGGDSLVFYYTYEETSSILPENGKRTNSASPTFSWHGLEGTKSFTRYHFQLDRDYFLDGLGEFYYDDSTLNLPTYSVSQPLGVDSVYYWRVRSHEGSSWGDWSRTFAAYIGSGAAPCCIGASMGNVDCEGIIDIGDVTAMTSNLFITLNDPCCEQEADIDQSGIIDIGDLTLLISSLFITLNPLGACP